MCLWYIVERENAVSEFEEQVGTEGYKGPEWQLRRNQHSNQKKAWRESYAVQEQWDTGELGGTGGGVSPWAGWKL
jgi:hypothetical protein